MGVSRDSLDYAKEGTVTLTRNDLMCLVLTLAELVRKLTELETRQHRICRGNLLLNCYLQSPTVSVLTLML